MKDHVCKVGIESVWDYWDYKLENEKMIHGLDNMEAFNYCPDCGKKNKSRRELIDAIRAKRKKTR